VAFVVQKEDIEISIFRRRDHSSIHIRMAARLPHEPGTQMVVLLTKVTTLLKHSPAFNRRQSIDDDAKRLATGVHVESSDASPVLRRTPIAEFLGHRCHRLE